MSTLIDCADTLNCATLSGSNNVNVAFQAGVPNKIVVSLSQSVVGLSNLEVTGTIKSKAMQLSNSGGYSYLEIGAPDGAYIDLKKPYTDDFDIRLITDNTIESGGYLQSAGGAILSLSGSNVGIGTKTPSVILEANGTIRSGRNDNSTEGGEIQLCRAYDNSLKWSIDCNGSNDNSNFRIFDNSSSVAFFIQSQTRNVGIGTTTPIAKLEISGPHVSQNGLLKLNSSAGSTAAMTFYPQNSYAGAIYFDTSNNMFFGTQGANSINVYTNGVSNTRMTIDTNGKVGIGTTNPGYTLTVTGSIAASNLLGGATTLSVDATGQIIRTPSDERLKENIQSLTGSLELISLMNPVRFNWKNKELFGDKTDIGLIAQEVKELFPETVSTDNDGVYGLDYTRLVPVLVDGVKQLKQENDDLKKTLNDVLARISALENK